MKRINRETRESNIIRKFRGHQMQEHNHRLSTGKLYNIISALGDAITSEPAKSLLPVTLGTDAGATHPGSEKEGSGRLFALGDPEPWPDVVDGEEILHTLESLFITYVAMSMDSAIACALWIVNTYTFDTARTCPILAITSPEKRCGKTTLLELISKICRRPFMTSSATPAAVFRIIETHSPTLLFDEGDLSVKGNSEMRCILNSGHTRSGATVTRCVGDMNEPRVFSTWAPKAVAAIGSLEETLQDRSIQIRLQRKRKEDKVARLRELRDSMLKDLQKKLTRWSQDNAASLSDSYPVLPEELHDRAQDNWEPLLSIAEIVGGCWPELARKAALSLCRSDLDEDALGVRLLKDLKSLFDDADEPKISSEFLVQRLNELEESPWNTYKGKGINPNQVSTLLKQFEISSKQIRFGTDNRRGYEREQFNDAFERYLDASITHPVAATTLHEDCVIEVDSRQISPAPSDELSLRSGVASTAEALPGVPGPSVQPGADSGLSREKKAQSGDENQSSATRLMANLNARQESRLVLKNQGGAAQRT